MINSRVARRAPRNARSSRGTASLPKPLGFQGGMPLWSQDTFRCPRRGGSEALEGGTRSGSPSKDPTGGWVKPYGRGACRDRTPRHNFTIITEFRMLPQEEGIILRKEDDPIFFVAVLLSLEN